MTIVHLLKLYLKYVLINSVYAKICQIWKETWSVEKITLCGWVLIRNFLVMTHVKISNVNTHVRLSLHLYILLDFWSMSTCYVLDHAYKQNQNSGHETSQIQYSTCIG